MSSPTETVRRFRVRAECIDRRSGERLAKGAVIAFRTDSRDDHEQFQRLVRAECLDPQELPPEAEPIPAAAGDGEGEPEDDQGAGEDLDEGGEEHAEGDAGEAEGGAHDGDGEAESGKKKGKGPKKQPRR